MVSQLSYESLIWIKYEMFFFRTNAKYSTVLYFVFSEIHFLNKIVEQDLKEHCPLIKVIVK